MKHVVALLGILVMLAALPAEAKNCKKGQPCGNSCISWSKTCHIGTSSPKSSSKSTTTSPDRAAYKYEPQAENPISPARDASPSLARYLSRLWWVDNDIHHMVRYLSPTWWHLPTP